MVERPPTPTTHGGGGDYKATHAMEVGEAPKSGCGEGVEPEKDYDGIGDNTKLDETFEVPEDAPLERVVNYIRGLQLCASPGVHFVGRGDLSDEEIHVVAQHVFEEENEDDYADMPPLIPVEEL